MSTLPVFEGWSPWMTWSDFAAGQWGAVRCIEQGPLPFHPGAMGLQFGASVFEGCKALRVSATQAHAFRLGDHHARLRDSCDRLCIPCPPMALFEEAVQRAAGRASAWSTPFAGDWLYIRPVIVGLDDHIMPVVAQRYAFYVLVAPIRPFDPPSFTLSVEQQYRRATPGGLGAAKTAANYAHQFRSTALAREAGSDAVLWLSPIDGQTIEEASTMNLFFRVGDRVLTPALKDTILPGITRRSVIDLLQGSGIPVSECAVRLDDVLGWIDSGELQEVFASSTALGVRAIDFLRVGEGKHACARNPELSKTLAAQLLQAYRGTHGSFGWWPSPMDIAKE